MFQENVEMAAAAEKALKIPTGEFEAEVGGVTTYKATKEGQANSWIVTFVVNEGEFEGCEYTYFVTQKGNDRKAAGFRASFYRSIGYVMPEDGAVDENTWVGLPATISVFNPTSADPKLNRVGKTKKADSEGGEVGGESNKPADVDFV